MAAISFYIDDMVNPTLTHDNAGGVGMNCIQLSSLQNYGVEGPVGGYFDDFYFQDGVAAPAITGGLTNQTVNLGDTVTLAVSGVTGTPAPALYWQKDGEAVTNSNQISGVGTSALTISGDNSRQPGRLFGGGEQYRRNGSEQRDCRSSGAADPGQPIAHGGTVLASLGGAVTFSVTAHAGPTHKLPLEQERQPALGRGDIFGSATADSDHQQPGGRQCGDVLLPSEQCRGGDGQRPGHSRAASDAGHPQPTRGLVIGAGSNATFTVAAVGPDLVYLWSKGATPLSGGGRVSGAASASLSYRRA